MERSINTAINEVVIVEKLRVLDQPKIDLKKFVPFTEAEFVATIDVLPEIKLGDYKNLKVKKVVEEVKDSEVETVFERLKQSMAEKKEVKRSAKDGDEVTINFVGKKDDKPFEGGKGEDYPLVLGSKSFIPGFEEALAGHKKGDKFDLPLTFPKDYHVEELKGKKVVFEVEIKKISEVILPEVNDEFAAKIGPFKTKDELVDDVWRELKDQKNREADGKFKDDLIEALAKKSKVPLPDILIDDQIRSIEKDARQNLMYRGLTVEQYLHANGFKNEEEWREKEFVSLAKMRVTAGLLLAEISRIEKIDVTKEELEERLADMLSKYPNMKDQLDSPDARRDIANRAVTEKTLERLVALNS